MSALRIIVTSVLASAAIAGAAFAQDNALRGDGQLYELQRRQPEGRFPAGDDLVGVDRGGPRFIVEAISFKAVDESDYDYPYTSDEIFAVFSGGGRSTITSTFDDVDTGETRRFASHQSCIWPAIDPDGTNNDRWACDPAGGAGPIEFQVSLYDDDLPLPLSGFCVSGTGATDVASERLDGSDCGENNSVFHGELRYETSAIIQRLRPECRCFVQTARHSVDDRTTYEFTFRITMVDGGSDLAVLDENATATGPIVHRNGALTASLNQSFEFDAGTVVDDGGDLLFMRQNGSLVLQPRNGARILMGSVNPRGHAGCVAAAASHVSARIQTPDVGSHACYITSDGRVGELRVTAETEPPFGGGPATLSITYTTWQ